MPKAETKKVFTPSFVLPFSQYIYLSENELRKR
jgi:hypothetical protein